MSYEAWLWRLDNYALTRLWERHCSSSEADFVTSYEITRAWLINYVMGERGLLPFQRLDHDGEG